MTIPRYFIINPRRRYWGDRAGMAALAAMRVYADGIRDDEPDYAAILDKWVKEEENYDPTGGHVYLGKGIGNEPKGPGINQEVLEALRKAWAKYPQLRLCQLIVNVTGIDETYHVEDSTLKENLDTWDPFVAIEAAKALKRIDDSDPIP